MSTFTCDRNENQVKPNLFRMFANTGSTIPILLLSGIQFLDHPFSIAFPVQRLPPVEECNRSRTGPRSLQTFFLVRAAHTITQLRPVLRPDESTGVPECLRNASQYLTGRAGQCVCSPVMFEIISMEPFMVIFRLILIRRSAVLISMDKPWIALPELIVCV